MLGADVVVAELQRLAERELEDLLGPRRERDVPGRRRAALSDDLLDLAADGLQRDAERLERLGGDALTLVDQPEQDVLGADVVVVEEPSFLLGQHDDPSGSVGEPFEQVSLPPLRLGEPWVECIPAPLHHTAGGTSARFGARREPRSSFSARDGPAPTVRVWRPQSPLHQLPGMAGYRTRVEDALTRVVAAEDELMAQMGGHLITAGGKRARPLFTVASAAALAPDAAVDRRRRHGRRDPRWRLGGARAGRLAVPRRRDRRGRDPPRRRERQPALGQPQGDPRRRLPAGQGLGDRRRPGHRGGRPAGRHDRQALRGRGERAAARLRPGPHDRVVPHRHRGQDRGAVRHGLPRRRDRRRPAPRPHRPAHRASGGTTAWPSRSSTTSST